MNRRDVLGWTATTAIGLTMSPMQAFPQALHAGPEMTALCEYMSAARGRDLPAEVAEHTKYHFLDTLAAIVSGSQLPPGQAAQRYIRD
ncbi:MAG: MmgE/PrpD family protein, partial [Bradyrhizobiaceae bacterium]|nr:MmgE/PrpD family protein [Bradyrhizobiaceae bacterium]